MSEKITINKEQLAASLKDFTNITGLDDLVKSLNVSIDYNDMSQKLWDSIQKNLN